MRKNIFYDNIRYQIKLFRINNCTQIYTNLLKTVNIYYTYR